MERLPLPAHLVGAARRNGYEPWLDTLAATVRHLSHRWSLEVGAPFQPGGRTAWVAPARRPDGTELVLKVAWRHMEGEHEPEALGAWGGDGAVRLEAAERLDDQTTALLLERCAPATTLRARPDTEQDEVIARLLIRLWREPEPDHPFRSLRFMCNAWADEFDARGTAADQLDGGASTIDPGLTRQGMQVFRLLPATAERRVLLVTDLHADNVLASQREPWLAVDPKPFVGDPTYDALQHMLNCPDRLQRRPLDLVARMAGLLGLDRDRLALWLFARCVQESPHQPALADVARTLAPS